MDNFDLKKFLIENRTMQKENFTSGYALSQMKFALQNEPKPLVRDWFEKISTDLKAGDNKYRSYDEDAFMKDYKDFKSKNSK